LAFDPTRRLKDWSLSIPFNRWQAMKDERYEVCIETSVKSGEMLIEEVGVQGSSNKTILFVADYCHPGQVNDSLSGLVVFLEVMKTLATVTKPNATRRQENNKNSLSYLFCYLSREFFVQKIAVKP